MSKMKYIRDFIKNINPDYRVRYGNVFEVDIPEEKIFITPFLITYILYYIFY